MGSPHAAASYVPRPMRHETRRTDLHGDGSGSTNCSRGRIARSLFRPRGNKRVHVYVHVHVRVCALPTRLTRPFLANDLKKVSRGSDRA
jgi:hypothetical protein